MIFKVGYRAEMQEVGYPGEPVGAVLLDAAPDETMSLAVEQFSDWGTADGVLGAAAVIAAHRLGAKPATEQVRNVAQVLGEAIEEDEAGEFSLPAETVDAAL